MFDFSDPLSFHEDPASYEFNPTDNPGDTTISKTSSGKRKKINIYELYEAIKNLDRDIEAPVRLFSLLKEQLLISKGAILLHEKGQHAFFPWGLTGFDKTTQYRLRIPESLITQTFGHNTTRPLIIVQTIKETLKPFFSIREYSMLQNTVLFPFNYNEKIIGLLLVVESPICNKPPNALDPLYHAIHEQIVLLLYSSREKKLNKLQSSKDDENSKNVIQKVEELIDTANNTQKELLLLLLSLGTIIDQIVDSISDVQPYRIKQDIKTILSSMVPDEGTIFSFENDRFLISLLGKTIPDPKLLVHQISVALKQFFTNMDNVPDIDYSVRRYPQDGVDAQVLLEEVL